MEARAYRTSIKYGPAAFVAILLLVLAIWRFGPVTPTQAAALAIAILFLLGLKRPVWVMAAILVSSLTLNNSLVHLSSSLVISVRLLLVMLAWVIVLMTSGLKGIQIGPKTRRILVPALILVVLSIIANSVNPGGIGNTSKDFRQWAAAILIALLLPAVVRNLKDLKILCGVVLVCLSASAAIAIMQHYNFLGMNQHTLTGFDVVGSFRAPGIAEAPLELSYVLASVLPIAAGIYLFKGVKGGTRSFMMASFVLMLLGTYFTYTRSALMGVAVGFVALAMLVRSRDRLKILLVLFLVGFVFLLFSQAHDTRLVSTTDTSAEGRVVLRDAGIDIARDHPLFGIGAYNFETVSLQYASRINPVAFQQAGGYETLGQYPPHNDFVFLAACYGIPALIVFIWLLAIVLLSIRDTYRATGRPFIKGLSCGLIGALLAYLTNAYYHNCLFDIPLFWVLVGFSLAVAKLTLHDRKILGNSNGIRPST